MTNRIFSLFDLDDLIGGGRTGNGHARARTPGRSTSGTTPPPTNGGGKSHAVPRKKKKSGAVVVAQSFDKGEPIRCQHGVAYVVPPPVDVQTPAPPAEAVAHQLSDEYDVEAFEDEPDDSGLTLSDLQSEEEEASRVSLSDELSYGRGAHDSEYPTPSHGGYSDDAAGSNIDEPVRDAARSRSYSVSPRGATFAAEMAEVERDLAELAARSTPPDASLSPDVSIGDAEPVAAFPPAPPPSGHAPSGHAVFDQMAQGLNYATEFRLPAVRLSQVFSALDRQLDADAQVTPVASVPPSLVAQPVVTPEATIVTPGADTLIHDLIAMPGGQTPEVTEST